MSCRGAFVRAHAGVTRVLAVVLAVLGVAILVRTAVAGGGQVGVLIGLLFIGLGLGRFYLAWKGSR